MANIVMDGDRETLRARVGYVVVGGTHPRTTTPQVVRVESL